ncbi:hypothetical protein AUK40_06160 [Candidatus Wirthbacteria bacterium CG2_30_54_11]|uniref:Phosphoribosyltransferase domain-containing protein n=1 Tax=Candidatus Wirthbacteria bacterium CG2_30_54_11 TaxID=1817892 RepID=A0A1J5ISQ7_9BACT|nr:MAG: hypothetical protein AUK40_06160 [Candidatus Wirthbacteria bacterium CG2_30_54_11]
MYTIADLNPMTYDEYATAVSAVTSRLRMYCIEQNMKFDIIVPILRSGAIPAAIIAHNLDIQHFLPIQVYHDGDGIKEFFSMPTMLEPGAGDPSILICDNNTARGSVARRTIELVKGQFPRSRLYYSTVVKVYGGPDSYEGVEKYIYGIQSDELGLADPQSVADRIVRRGITLFPWEDAMAELAAISRT